MIDSVTTAFTSLPIDGIAILVFGTIVLVDTLRSGASRAVALALGFTIATVLNPLIAAAFAIGPALAGFSQPRAQGIVFLVLAAVSTIIAYRISSKFSDDSGQPMLAIAAALATTAIILALWHMSPQLQGIWTFSAGIQAAFDPAYRFYWLILGYIALAFVRS